jgi:ADP-ribose pyrophosphatase YjhB (NUDIX family)
MARACGILVHDGKILLQRKRNESICAVPGGKLEGVGTPEAALVREWIEELEQTLAVRRLMWVFENRFTHGGTKVLQIEYCFEVDAGSGQPHRVDDTLEFA